MQRSPLNIRKHGNNNALTPRPYSMFVGAQYSRSSSDLLSLASSNNSSSHDQHSPTKSTNSSTKSNSGRIKRNSSAEFSAPSFNGATRLLEISNSNIGLDYINYSNYSQHSGGKKKHSSTFRREVMPPAGPSAKTWIVPKSIKKLSISGNVFGVHIGKSGTCYVSVVSDKGDRLIQAFDRNGNLTKSFPSRATKAGKPFEPYQIHETPDGYLAVASGNCVTVWSKDGKLVIEHGKNMFKFAKCLAVRSTGEIVVTDTDNKAVKIISASGQQIYKLDGNFTCPVGVAVDSNDYIIVSDWTDKISIFDADNQLVHTFGVKGSNPGEMDLPYGVSVDSENNIIVADMWNHRLSVYTQQGEFLKHLASEPGQSVRMPAHVSVAAGLTAEDYRLAVTDFGANSVKLFNY